MAEGTGLHSNCLLVGLCRTKKRSNLRSGYRACIGIPETPTINESYLCRILRLTLLAPEIAEMILDGRQPATLKLDSILSPMSALWFEQSQIIDPLGSE